jgi:lipopolysaccharide heptosyltransferase I
VKQGSTGLPESFSKILVVKPSSLGDIVHSLPFLHSFQTCFPDTGVHWVVAQGFEEIFERHPMVKKLWIINKDEWKKLGSAKDTLRELKGLFRGLRDQKYDLVVDLQGLFRSGVITAATKAPVRIGFREAREGSRMFYTHTVTGGRDLHAIDRYLKIADYLGCDTSDIRFPFPPLNEVSFSEPLPGKYAVFVPGARWHTKKWPPEKFGRLAGLLPFTVVVVGGKSDIDLGNKIVRLSGGKAVSLAGSTDLRQLIKILQGAEFVVSNDSGPMHIAAALGRRVYALFGPTEASRTGPYGKGHLIIRADVECSPCFRKKCNDLKCMERLSVQQVFQAIRLSFS